MFTSMLYTRRLRDVQEENLGYLGFISRQLLWATELRRRLHDQLLGCRSKADRAYTLLNMSQVMQDGWDYLLVSRPARPRALLSASL